MPHGMNAAVREIVNVEKFPHRRSAPPDGDGIRTVDLRFMESANQRRWYMTVLGVEIVAGTKEVGRHDRHEVSVVLFVKRLAHLDARDLRDRIPLVGRLE